MHAAAAPQRPFAISGVSTKANRTTYNRIYAEGYQDAYRQLKSSGQIQLYRMEYVPKNEASPKAGNELGR
jgi:hypothetical protein